jgi:predicted dehydrogenase
VTRRIKVGVAGLGAIAQTVHLPLLSRRWDMFDLAAICDLSPSLRVALGEQYGVSPSRRYGDVDAMVADGGLDSLILLTSGSHGGTAVKALRTGVPVFCEKPLAHTVAEIDALAEAEKELGHPAVQVGYMKEHDDTVARLRERLAAVDDVRAVEVCVLHPSGESQLEFANLRPPAGDVDPAAVDAARSGQTRLLDRALGRNVPDQLRDLYANVVLGSLVHDTSLLRYLFGGLTRITEARTWPDGVQPGSVEVAGELAGGAPSRMSWHFLPEYPAYRETLTVYHGRGMMQVTFGTPYVLNAVTRLDIVEPGPGGELHSTFTSTGESFEHELVDFHRMVVTGAPPRAGVAEGRADTVTSQRIVRLLAERQGVTLDGEAASA